MKRVIRIGSKRKRGLTGREKALTQDGNARAALIQALIPIGLEAAAEELEGLDEGEHDPLLGFQGFDRGCLVLTYETAVSDHVGAEDSGEPSLELLCRHRITPQRKEPPRVH